MEFLLSSVLSVGVPLSVSSSVVTGGRCCRGWITVLSNDEIGTTINKTPCLSSFSVVDCYLCLGWYYVRRNESITMGWHVGSWQPPF